MKIDLLAIGAHPDDVELGAGGTIAKEVALGRKVGILDLTRGELGTRGSADERDMESAKSAEILGVEFRTNLAFKDGFFANDEAHQMAILPFIRYYRPEIIICNAMSDRHPDHGKAAELVSVASFLSGLQKIETFWEEEKQAPWRPKAVYHFIQDRYRKPDIIVDITPYMEKKMESVMAFKTQFFNPESNEPVTAISSKEFLEFLYARSIEYGRPIGVHYGEGFNVERIPGINSLFELV